MTILLHKNQVYLIFTFTTRLIASFSVYRTETINKKTKKRFYSLHQTKKTGKYTGINHWRKPNSPKLTKNKILVGYQAKKQSNWGEKKRKGEGKQAVL